jgi:hypothetical protein
MDTSDRDTKPRNEIDILLSLGRRLENEGDIQGAINSYQLALAHLPEVDPRRAELQGRISELESGIGPDSELEAPLVVRPAPRIPPERVSPPRPIAPRTTEPQTQTWNASIEADARPAEENQRIVRPVWSWLLMGCAVLSGLALPIIVALFFFQVGLSSLPGLGERALGQTISTPTPLLPSSAQRAPTAAAPMTAPPAATSGASLPENGRQATTFFEDSFDRSTLDGSKWIVDNSSDTIIDLSHATLRLASSSSHFPYVHSRVDPFPASGDFRVTARFRYTSAGTCGAPIAMANFVLPAGLSHADTDQLSNGAEASGISIWFWRTVAYYRAGSKREDISVTVSSGWHVATVDYVAGVYRLAIDSTTIYTSGQTSARPAVIWLGVPFDLGSGNTCQWDSLEISNVRIESLH